MSQRLDEIVNSIKTIDYAEIVQAFEENENALTITGRVALTVNEHRIEFAVSIYPQYPLQFHDTETIRFVNRELLDYDHVNGDGSICVHTFHSPVMERKVQLDFNSLKHWITKYYINKEKDAHYEHIIVSPNANAGLNPVFLFTEVDYTFRKGQFGRFTYSTLATGILKEKNTATNLVQDFIIDKITVSCKWNKAYKALAKQTGIFCYIENPPIRNRRFAVDNWQELQPVLSQEFLSFLYRTSKDYAGNRNRVQEIPLLLGYKISDTEIHWQAIQIPSNRFPTYGEKVQGLGIWAGRLHDQEILWAETRNCSYKYFFGRGKLHLTLTGSKILIIGIGAVGSMLATTLARGGCTNIVLFDHDGKEPENVCRSDYRFSTGILDKVTDLAGELAAISPFAEVSINQRFIDFAKMGINDDLWKDALTQSLDEYDIIFDCTADNDVAHILDQLSARSKIFNLSITNHAKELVCAISPGSYRWVMEMFEKLENDVEDLYNPAGCWSPTFKASYNDIAVLVQYAIKQINNCFENGLPVRNFFLSTESGKGFTIKLNQF